MANITILSGDMDVEQKRGAIGKSVWDMIIIFIIINEKVVRKLEIK